MLEILYAIIILAVIFAFGLKIVREDEYAVLVILGIPITVFSSGPCYTFWPLGKLRRFTQNLVELEFREATIITKKEGEFGSANIKAEPSMFFRWPGMEKDRRNNYCLINALRVVGNYEDREKLKDLFEEPVLDALRSVGGGKSWFYINQERNNFAKEVLRALINESEDPVKEACLQSVKLVITHISLPDNLEKAIIEPEVARMKRDAVVAEAEGTRRKKELEGEGDAYARQKLYEAIGKEPENLQKEVLLTLREMAKGTSNTILFQIPSQVTDVLGNIFGKKSGDNMNLNDFFSNLSGEKKKFLIDLLEEMINRK